jgi:hypothetical protein
MLLELEGTSLPLTSFFLERRKPRLFLSKPCYKAVWGSLLSSVTPVLFQYFLMLFFFFLILQLSARVGLAIQKYKKI